MKSIYAGSFFYANMEYSLLMQKMKEGSTPAVKDSYTDFGIVCTEVPFLPIEDIKELPVKDWKDEDGEEVLVPDSLSVAAYDWNINMGYKGSLNTCYTKISEFISYLKGGDGMGVMLKVYSPYTRIGRQKVYFKGMSDFEFSKSGNEDLLLFSITLRVTDPVTDITLAK